METQETVRGRAKPGKKKGSLSKNTQKVIELCNEHGLDPKEAYLLVNGRAPNPSTITRTKQLVEKFALSAPSMQKLAHSAVKDVLKGKETQFTTQKMGKDGQVVDVKETIVPSHTNKLAAASMVMDRVDPIVRRNENLNVNVDCPIDLSAWRNR